MRLKTVMTSALLLGLIGAAAAACSNLEPDPNPYQFIENRNDP